MNRPDLLNYLAANAVLSGPALDVSGQLFRYSATLHGHQAVSAFFLSPEEAKQHALATLADAVEAHSIEIPELVAADLTEVLSAPELPPAYTSKEATEPADQEPTSHD